MAMDDRARVALESAAERIHERRDEMVSLAIEAAGEKPSVAEIWQRREDYLRETLASPDGLSRLFPPGWLSNEHAERLSGPEREILREAGLSMADWTGEERAVFPPELSLVGKSAEQEWPHNVQDVPKTLGEAALFLAELHDSVYRIGENGVFAQAVATLEAGDDTKGTAYARLLAQRDFAAFMPTEPEELFPANATTADVEAALADWTRVAFGEADAAGDDDSKTPDRDDVAHSPDFRSLRWFGKTYSFTERQAPAVAALFEAWRGGTPEVGRETVLQAVDHAAPPSRVDNLFRNSPAWKLLIAPGSTRGTYRLKEPDA